MEASPMMTHATTLSTRPRLDHGLAPDPALPARDDLLDPALVADLLSASLGRAGRLDVSGAELMRVKYRMGESVRVLYRLNVAGRTHLVTGRMFTGGRGTAAHREAARQALPSDALPSDALRANGLRANGLRATALDLVRDTVWWSFPNDRRLIGLEAVLDPARLPPALRNRVGDWSENVVVEYEPGRSVTTRALDPAGQTLAFVKCYAPDTLDVARLAARYDVVASRLSAADPTLSSPRALAHSRDHRVLLLEPMPGRSWLDLDRPSAVDAMHRLGRAIAVVHTIPVDSAATGAGRFSRLDLARVTRAGELISRARPEVTAIVRRLTERLAQDPPEPAEQVLLHGDCHPGNVLAARDGVSLIDLDQAGTGPAAADIGSLLARLTDGAILGESDPDRTALMADAFLESYGQVRTLPDDNTLRWYAAAALLGERGVRAVSRIRPRALAHLGDVARAGHDLLDGRSRP
jgi:Ser/Thr protein kinase RdoA (MazF antagonist)